MAHDDLHVLMYKVLAYLYDCMKTGKEPQKSMLSAEGPIFQGVPESYRVHVMREIELKGLVRGVIVRYADNTGTVVVDDPCVTLEGVGFMQENTMMRKSASFLKEAKSSLPFL